MAEAMAAVFLATTVTDEGHRRAVAILLSKGWTAVSILSWIYEPECN